LPQRIQEWGLTPCIAEEKNKKELEQIRKQQTDAREALEELDLKQKVEFYNSVKFFRNVSWITVIPMQELDFITAKAKKFTVDINSDDEGDEDDGETESATVQCVTCGIGVTRKSIIIADEKDSVLFPSNIYT